MNIAFIKPMECLSATKLPRGEQWPYEIKLNGFRVEAIRTADSAILYSKQGKLLTRQFMQVALELGDLPAGAAIDGELVALDGDGVPRFNLLQNYRSGSAHLMFFAFDILSHEGRDLTKQPLSERRALLRSVVQRSKHVEVSAWSSDLDTIEQFVRKHKLEGVVAKQAHSRYEPARHSGAWVKLRYNCRQEFVIGGYTPATWDSTHSWWASTRGRNFASPLPSEEASLHPCGARCTEESGIVKSLSARSQTFLTSAPEPGTRDHAREDESLYVAQADIDR